MNEEICAPHEDMDPLKVDVHDLQTQHLQDFAVITRISIENKRLVSEMSIMNDKVENLENLLEIRNSKVTTLENELERTREEVFDISQRRLAEQQSAIELQEEYKSQLDSIISERKKMKRSQMEWHKEKDSLSLMIERIKFDNVRKEDNMNQHNEERFRSKIALLKEKHELDRRQIRFDVEEIGKKKAMDLENSFRVQINSLKTKIRKMKEHHRDSTKSLEEELSKKKKVIEEVKEFKLDNLHKRIRELSSQIKILKRKNSEYKKKGEELSRHISRIETINKNLETKLKKSKSERKSQRKYFELRMEPLKEYQEILEKCKKAEHDLEQYKKRYGHQKNSQGKDLKKMKLHTKNLEKEINELKDTIADMTKELASKQKTIEKLKNQESEFKEMIQQFTVLVKEQETKENLLLNRIAELRKVKNSPRVVRRQQQESKTPKRIVSRNNTHNNNRVKSTRKSVRKGKGRSVHRNRTNYGGASGYADIHN